MAGSADRNRSAIVNVTTPRGAIDVMHQEMRGLRQGSGGRTFWRTRRSGRRDWVQASSLPEAIRRAALLAPKRTPAWLAAAVADAQRQFESTDEPGGATTPPAP